MTAFGSGLSVGSRETFGVSGLKPGNAVFCFVLGHVGVPGHKTDGLANIGAGIDAMGLEERMLLVP